MSLRLDDLDNISRRTVEQLNRLADVPCQTKMTFDDEESNICIGCWATDMKKLLRMLGVEAD